MGSKTRLWRRKLSEKTIIKERVLDLERSLKNLNEQLLFARNECDTKDDLISKQAKVVEEAIAGREKAEAEAVSFKLKLDDTLYQKAIAEEKVTTIDAALDDASVNLLQEREKTLVLEERLADTDQRLQQLYVEKNKVCGILDMKEKLIEDLNLYKSQWEADFTAIVERFDFSEKANESLKYEVLMLQKELVIRNQEREFNLRSLESAQKQHQANVRKINRLESECHRLRVMIQKRLPGPASVAKMRSEVEILGNSASERRRRNLNYTIDCSPDFAQEIGHKDELSKQLVRLHGVEDENKTLKETLKKKNSELQLSRIMFARTASKLSQVEKQVKESSKEPACLELDVISCSESWASALMSQLENFRNCKPDIGSSQSSLMDDFEEMEKLAIICADHKPEEGSSTEEQSFMTPKSLDLKPDILESMSKELVTLEKLSTSGEFDHGNQSCIVEYEKYPTKSKVIPDGPFILSKMDIIGSNLKDENRELKQKIINVESGKKDLEEILKSVSAKNQSLVSRFQESEKCISNLQAELKTLMDSRGLVEDQKLINQDLGAKITSAKVELNETHQKFSSLEVDLEQTNNFCEEMKATRLELQIQIESVPDKDMHTFDMVQEEKELKTDCEISAASEKLAECQETILQLGKQLKALASPKNAALFDNMISRNSPKPQLLEELMAIDNAKFVDLKSPHTKEIICSGLLKTDSSFMNGRHGSVQFVADDQDSGIRHALRAKSIDRSHGELSGRYTQKCGTEVGTLVSIPKKQKGGIFLLKNLLSRKKKTAIRSWS